MKSISRQLANTVLTLSIVLPSLGVLADTENKQSMASSPEALTQMLANSSFMPPEAYRNKYQAQLEGHIFPLEVGHLPQRRDENSDPARDITAAEIQGYADHMKEISLQSKRDGEILWGRIQGTKYERQTLDWAAKQLRSFGIEDVRVDHFPGRFPQWYPTANELVVTGAPSLQEGEYYSFDNAITPFPSGLTPSGGIEAELIYVGEGTPAELQGRDLNHKLVLLRSRGNPGVLLHSARTAFSRIAAGSYGKPAGVVVWWDVPGANQVAGRVGAAGGGDSIGKAIPWISIGNDDGFYLRKLLDRATPEKPVTLKMNVQGEMQQGDQRMSANVYGVLPGRSGKYIIVTAHADSYFYGYHDNAATAGMVMSLARHYANIPQEKRAHGLIFLFVGDHEHPGAGATDKFIEQNRQLVENDLLLVLRPEKLGLKRQLDEGFIQSSSNIADPMMLMITNQSPLLVDIFTRAINHYAIPSGDFFYIDPAADETFFHPPYNDLDVISAGWAQTGITYHSTADVEQDLVSFKEMEKQARAHAFVIDQLAPYSKDDLKKGGHPAPEKSIYRSDMLKMIYGNH